jgi:broad specificity phosphatase PhoE
MRHGEPEIPRRLNKINAQEFLRCLEIYKSCGILDTSKPKDELIDLFCDFKAVVSSDLKRSIESASLLTSQNALIIDSKFREIEDSFIPIPFIKLTPRAWSNIFILLWLAGIFELKKTFREGKLRARYCAEKLIALAEEHGRVLCVGHGFMNTYIARELILLGWRGPKRPGKRYWDYGVYHKNPPQ